MPVIGGRDLRPIARETVGADQADVVNRVARMAQAGRVVLRARDETADAAAVLARRRFCLVDFEIKRVCECVRADFIGLQIAFNQVVALFAILEAERDVEVAGKACINWQHEVCVER